MRALRVIIKDRAFQKAMTWRVIALIALMGVTFWATGSLAITGKIGVVDAIFKTFLYWLHEKAWERVDKPSVGPPPTD